jgi:hypothetical protein
MTTQKTGSEHEQLYTGMSTGATRLEPGVHGGMSTRRGFISGLLSLSAPVAIQHGPESLNQPAPPTSRRIGHDRLWPKPVVGERAEHDRSAQVFQTSTSSAIAKASSTSMPRYLTVSDLATTTPKRELFARLAVHLNGLADEVERAMRKIPASQPKISK